MSDKPGMMQITFGWPSKHLSPNARVHWAVRSKKAKEYRAACYINALAAKPLIDWEGDIHLWVDYYPPDKRARDQDNMISSSKALFDGLADALKVNDKRFRLHPYVKDEIGGMVKVSITRGIA